MSHNDSANGVRFSAKESLNGDNDRLTVEQVREMNLDEAVEGDEYDVMAEYARQGETPPGHAKRVHGRR